jgi:phospholipid/cholesterol/gamma-HCH transport system substrate-binding protein
LHDFIYGADDTDRSTLAAMRSATERLESVLRKIDEGEGSCGALVNDPTIYEDLKILLSGAKESSLLRSLIEFVRTDEAEAP